MVVASRRNVPIIVAAVSFVVIVAAAYFFSGHGIPSPFKTADAASSADTLKAYVAKDTDGDGLPDWEEAIYGTDPNNPNSVQPSITDGELVAQGAIKPVATSTAEMTVTDRFAQQFFQSYMETYGTAPSGSVSDDDMSAFASDAITKYLGEATVTDAYTVKDLHSSAAGKTALVAYAVATENILKKNNVPGTQSEIDYMDAALENSDPTALDQVAKIGAAYTAIAQAYIKVPVPPEAKAAHLEIVNAFASLGTVITDMSTSDTDPIRSMQGLSLYQQAASSLSTAFTDLGAAFTADDVVIPADQPGFSVYKIATQPATTPTP